MLICTCSDHLERALDDLVEKQLEAPEMFYWRQLKDTGAELEDKCRYCEKEAVYVVVSHAD